MVQSFILSNSGSTDDAKDIFQEALIVLYERVKSGSFELNCLIKTYLFAVSRRLWLKRLQQLERQGVEIDQAESIADIPLDLELAMQRNAEFDLMEKAMIGLGEPCRSLLESYYIKKRSMTEIALDFGYTNADNAKNQKYKCLMRLKKIFFEQYKNPDSDTRKQNVGDH